MNWEHVLYMIGQIAALITLAVLVGMGHDSVVLDALMAVAGSLTLGSVPAVIKGIMTPPATK